MGEDFGDHRRIFDACPERVEGAAIIFKAPPQLGQCSKVDIEDPFEQSGPAHAWCLSLRLSVFA